MSNDNHNAPLSPAQRIKKDRVRSASITADGMDCDLGRALAACPTSANWSTLESVATKVSKKLGRPVKPRELENLMVAVGDEELRLHGIWRQSFGAKYMPIVVVNRAYAQAVRAAGDKPCCTCGAVAKDAGKANERYFGSHDYNAGRHVCTASAHKPNCPMWCPPTSGHLHSWRRGFQE